MNKKITCIAAFLLFILFACIAYAEAETVTVRLDFTRFNQSFLQTPLTGNNYYDFENVDVQTSIMHFQEFILKEAFPELSEFGKSAEKVLAYTDQNGLLYDGVTDTVSTITDRVDEHTVTLYLWEGMYYLQWRQGGKPILASDAFVFNFLEENVHQTETIEDTFVMEDVSFAGVTGTDMVLNQVFLNRESVFFSIRKGDNAMLFTQAISDAPTGIGLRLTLTVVDKTSGLRLHYNQEALRTLEDLNFSEVCLSIDGKEQVFSMKTLKGV